jgi:hypothetical protein
MELTLWVLATTMAGILPYYYNGNMYESGVEFVSGCKVVSLSIVHGCKNIAVVVGIGRLPRFYFSSSLASLTRLHAHMVFVQKKTKEKKKKRNKALFVLASIQYLYYFFFFFFFFFFGASPIGDLFLILGFLLRLSWMIISFAPYRAMRSLDPSSFSSRISRLGFVR